VQTKRPTRPPSPARPTPPNTTSIVAGEGPGVGEHQVAVPQKAIDIPTQQSPMSGVSQANVWREPHGGRVASAPAGGTQRGSSITAKQNHRNTQQNDPFASRPRPARVHQPADADRSPANTQALPKPTSYRSQTPRPRQASVNRPNRLAGVGLTNAVLRERSICAGVLSFGSRACSDRMGRRRERRAPSWVISCGAPACRIEVRLQPPGNTPRPPSANVVPAHQQHSTKQP
jgi:hypothetical protein